MTTKQAKKEPDVLIVSCGCDEFVYQLAFSDEKQLRKQHGKFCVDCSEEIIYQKAVSVVDKSSATNLTEIGF